MDIDGGGRNIEVISEENCEAKVIASHGENSLQLADSESADSGFLDIDPPPSSPPPPPSSPPPPPTSETVDERLSSTAVPETDTDVSRIAEYDGSLLGMLFRRSTMRRSMRPFVPSTVSSTGTIAGPSLLSDNSLVQGESSTEGVEDDSTVKLSCLSRSESLRDSRRNAARSVQFTMDTSVNPSTVDTVLGSIPEHETFVVSSTGAVNSNLIPPPPPSPSPPAAAGNAADEPQPPPTPPPNVTPTSTNSDIPVSHRPETNEEREERTGGFWKNASSPVFASLACTIGMFDIDRFAYLSVQYGGGFILQFLMLSVIFGFPMLTFQMSIGQYMGAGVMNMWKASPIFQGIGMSALFGMALIGIYNVVPVSWLFIYFRDSFVTTVTFKWGECRNFMSFDECQRSELNSTEVFKRAVPAYFQNKVLARQSAPYQPGTTSDLVFENVFNLAVIWTIVFICLSKGMQSYGKVVLVFGIVPLTCFYLVAVEMLRRGSSGAEQILNVNTNMNEFFLNGWSWLAAAREVFFIWGLNGMVLMQIASHNKFRHNLKRDCAVVIVITLSVIMLSAFLGCACIFVIYKAQRFSQRFIPSSYESLEYSQFLIPANQAVQMTYDLGQYMSTNYILGVASTTLQMDVSKASGYQVGRLATELYPMTIVSLGPQRVSAFWPVLFYLSLIGFGLARQLVIWKCVIEGLVSINTKHLRSWETCITFFVCFLGFIFGLPFTTQVGSFALYFMDVCVGCAWWLLIIYLAQIFALVFIRGHPFTSDEILTVFTDTPWTKTWLAPIIGFSWNVSLPVTLLVLAISSFKIGDFGQMFEWNDAESYIYWPYWAKQLGTLIQLTPIIMIPLVSFVQASRYLGRTNQAFATRMENLVRPNFPYLSCICDLDGSGLSHVLSGSHQSESQVVHDDPPPKYTPPPSYNTATGLKILKHLNSLRMSFRRSQRGRRSINTERPFAASVPSVEMQPQSSVTIDIPSDVPPSYAAVVEAGVVAAAAAAPPPPPPPLRAAPSPPPADPAPPIPPPRNGSSSLGSVFTGQLMVISQ